MNNYDPNQPFDYYNPPQYQQPQPPAPKNKNATTLIIGLLVALLAVVVLLGGVFLVTETHKKTNATPTSVVTVTQPAPQPSAQPQTSSPAAPQSSNPQSDPNYLPYSTIAQDFGSAGIPLTPVDTGNSCIKIGSATNPTADLGVLAFDCDYSLMPQFTQTFESNLGQGGVWYKVHMANWTVYSTSRPVLESFVQGYGAGTIEPVG